MGDEVGILIIDDDEQTQGALAHVLHAEGWQVRVVMEHRAALALLAQGSWKLVVANVTLTGLDGPVFTTLKELALAPASEGDKATVRVLFLVPQGAAPAAQPRLEQLQLPHVLKPIHLHDFLERVSDLLLETGAIASPIRQVRSPLRPPERRTTDRRSTSDRRGASRMFASRDDYFMSEEEIAEFERQEAEARKKKQKKPEPGSRLED